MSHESSATPRVGVAVAALGAFALLHFATVWLGLVFYFEPATIATFWPAAGVLLAALLVSPRRWWAVLVAITIAVDLLRTGLGLGPPGTPSAWASLANAAEALIGASLVRAAVGGIPRLDRPRDVLFLVFGAGLLATAIGALLGAGLLAWEQPGRPLGSSWRVWWFADALGALAVAPFLLAWRAVWLAPPPRPSFARRVEATLLFGGLAVSLAAVFGDTETPNTSGGLDLDFPYVVVPFGLWAALRFGARSATTTVLITAFTVVACTEAGRGPFAVVGQDVSFTVIELQGFLVVNTLLPLLVSTLYAAEARAREAHRESESALRSIIEATPDWVWETDARGVFTYSSPRVRDLLGYAPEEIVGRSVADTMAPADAERVRANLPERMRTPGRVAGAETIHLHKDGHEVVMETNAAPFFRPDGEVAGYRGVDRDVTLRRRAEEEAALARQELVEADKLISLGTLVSGVAHEVNNPNHFIMLNLPILRRAWEDARPVLERHAETHPDFRLANLPYAEMREEIPELLDEIIGGAERIRAIVSELRDYSRRAEPTEMGPVDVNEVVRAALTLLANPVKKGTRHFDVVYGDDLPEAQGNARRLEQVVINLILNALQSLPDPERGVRVATRFDPERRHVVVEVRDEGSGIAPEALAHIRDPFYTTRRESGGTGLGLAVSSRIVEEHGGALEYESAVGEGTTARLRVPVSEEEEG